MAALHAQDKTLWIAPLRRCCDERFLVLEQAAAIARLSVSEGFDLALAVGCRNLPGPLPADLICGLRTDRLGLFLQDKLSPEGLLSGMHVRRPPAQVISIALIAFAFAGAHIGRAGISFVCTILTGASFGAIRVWSQSTVSAVLMHAAYNFALCWLSFL